ncbi:FadR/GntR family transcriptional regulator [Agromyces seonyuensis]|uniref:GntR family transcriptional regulator n=1 Tax=Agromyces seonyuensis TaxID=2662446 RepID=A0A6I4P0Y0_9MICO|nr:GntR family transcriptional regulator [Agromyces seonyuensis]MWB99172.1 GntR family transcriptional regulator [Agromyces seonyuensis]
MPHTTGRADTARAVVFSPLDGVGRAELVARRLTDAIVTGVLHDGERLPSESQLARSLGVAVVTAREALESLRDQGLLQTKRGREGGSFVTFDTDASARMLAERLRGTSRIELRDRSLFASAIAGTAAEVAVDRASDDDLAALEEIDRTADRATTAGARRAVGRFQLEVAAISQSPRLVREELRIQAETGSLLWLSLREPARRDRAHEVRRGVIAAIRAGDADAARHRTVEHIRSATEWLIDEKHRLDAAARTETSPSSGGGTLPPTD